MYTIKSGDTLWDISKKYLGSAYEWPRLWRYNNRSAVVQVTGRNIPDPDLIYPGQKLVFPPLSKKPATSAIIPPLVANKPLKEQIIGIKMPIAISYKLDEVILPSIKLPNAHVDIKMKGVITLSTIESYPIAYHVNKNQLEAKITQATNTAFRTLVSDNKIAYDSTNKKITLGTKLVTMSKTPNAPSTAIGVEIDSKSISPKMTFTLMYPKLKGNINNLIYLAEKVEFVIEVTPDIDDINKPTDKSPLASKPATNNQWDKVFAVGMYTLATVIVVGCIVDDVFAIPDEPIGFPLAAGLASRGTTLWNGTGAIVQRAILPASFRFSLSVTPAATLNYAH